MPGKLIQKDYGLEYGKDSLSIQLESIEKFKSFVIVDDLIATGGTAKCVLDILKSENKTVLGLNVVIELTFLKGNKDLQCPVYSEIQFVWFKMIKTAFNLLRNKSLHKHTLWTFCLCYHQKNTNSLKINDQ